MKKNSSLFAYKVTDIFLALVFSFFILWTGFQGYSAIQQWKYMAFLLLFGGYLLLIMGSTCFLFARKKVSVAALFSKTGTVQKLILLYWLLTAISSIVSPYGSYTLIGMTRQEGLLTITLYCGCCLAVSVYGRYKPWILYVFGGTMTVFSLLSLLQMTGANPLQLFPNGVSYLDANIAYAGVYIGTVGNADLAAALLCLCIPMFLFSCKRQRLLLVPLALSIAVLCKLHVLAGLVGVSLGLLLSLPVVYAKRRKLLWLAVLAALLIGLVFILLAAPEQGLFYEIHQILLGNWNDNFGNGRIYIWKQVLSLVGRHLWFGTGPDTMAAAGIPGFDRYNAELDQLLSYTVDVAHNEYLNVLYHQGLPALLVLLAVLILSAVKWLRCDSSSATPVLGSALLCYSLQAFFGFSMCATAGVFWCIFGLFLAENKE